MSNSRRKSARNNNDHEAVEGTKPQKNAKTLHDYQCNGCNEIFSYIDHRSFVSGHHMKGSVICRESLFPCKGCQFMAYTERGLKIHVGACPPGLEEFNKGKKTQEAIEVINSTQMTTQHHLHNDANIAYAASVLTLPKNPVLVATHFNAMLANDRTVQFPGIDPGADSPIPDNIDNLDQSFDGDDYGNQEHNDYDIPDLSERDSSVEINQEDSSNSDGLHHNIGTATNNIDENELLEMMSIMESNMKNLSADKNFCAAIELESIIRATNAPLYLFDQIMDWTVRNKKHIPTRIPPISRESLYSMAAQQMYGKIDTKLRPFKKQLDLPSGRKVELVRFQLLPLILSILEDPYLDASNIKNLIFNTNKNAPRDNPFDVLDDLDKRYDGFYNDVETSVHYQETLRNLKLDPMHAIYCPLMKFLDAAQLAHLNSHTMEPLMMTLGIMVRDIRNDPKAWRPIGYIEDSSRITGSSTMTAAEKLEDYHYMLGYLLEEVKSVIGSAGLKWKFYDDDKNEYVRTLHFRVMMVVGDTKGADTWAGRYGSHWNTKSLSRDCTMLTKHADNPKYKCKQLRFSDIEQMTEDELKAISFRKILNHAFRDPSNFFGESPYGICAACPPEPLHVVLLGILVRLFQFFDANMTGEQKAAVEKAIAEIVTVQLRQGLSKDYPECSKFATGNIGQGHLSGKQKYARVFVLYLALLKTEVFNTFRNKNGKMPKSKKENKKKDAEEEAVVVILPEAPMEGVVSDDESSDGEDDESDSDDEDRYVHDLSADDDVIIDAVKPFKQTFDEDTYNALVGLVEECLCMYQWLTKEDGHLKMAFVGGHESPIAIRLEQFMETYKSVAPRFEGMGLKLYKFHILKKWSFYISLYGSPNNGDSSRNETGHIDNLKKCGRLTQQRADSINYQTGTRYYEMNLIRRIAIECGVYDKITKYEREMLNKKEKESCQVEEGEVNQDPDDPDLFVKTKGPYFRLYFSYSEDGEEVSICMKWLRRKHGKPHKDQSERSSFGMTVLGTVREKLKGYNGGREKHRLSTIDGSAETLLADNKGDGIPSIRACPAYRSGAPWNDYVTISWENEDVLPARVMMLLDFDTCDFDDVTFLESEMSDATNRLLSRKHDIRSGVHAIVHSASSTERDLEEERLIESSISTHYIMERDKMQLISIKLVKGLVLGIPDMIDPINNEVLSLFTVMEVPFWSSKFFDYEEFALTENEPDFNFDQFHWEEIE